MFKNKLKLDAILLYCKGTKHTLLGPSDDTLSSTHGNTYSQQTLVSCVIHCNALGTYILSHHSHDFIAVYATNIYDMFRPLVLGHLQIIHIQKT